MSIQGSINTGIATAGLIYSQSDAYAEKKEDKALAREVAKRDRIAEDLANRGYRKEAEATVDETANIVLQSGTKNEDLKKRAPWASPADDPVYEQQAEYDREHNGDLGPTMPREEYNDADAAIASTRVNNIQIGRAKATPMFDDSGNVIRKSGLLIPSYVKNIPPEEITNGQE